ncbi:uncharacterized protein K460DRAFT_420157 [Cucurbitaria berberidis CBS 394.84]|uniref:Uncharacterized protein n=1 Tax=Cucurbitaria berberidis CBS 394.84 TaxID=1168544 RepID=A0A9P4L4S0_9PLEO|nr:uncharacterized protein K460DRAFT_420157 [Cucurbitaria berberidis CBS 394.84]KAF1842226.1 hypothetical protein K460DRAFT_420157 [Cucurbitaria berberidis CBS 394.84]
MAPKSLLRYIFHHGAYSNSSTDASPLKLSESPHTEPTENPKDAVSNPPTTRLPPTTAQEAVLGDIVEAPNTDIDTDTHSITKTLTTLNLDIKNWETRDLIHATIDEARLATQAHLDTISTTLALLDALEGFSPTILVLRKEMEGKKLVCEGKLKVLQEVEGAAEQMHFGDESGAVAPASESQADI